MILVDTSAWVEYLRATGSPTHHALRDLIAGDGAVASTDVVRMELLAGARSDAEARGLGRLLAAFTVLPIEPGVDFDRAARIYRACRARGETIRSLADCLVAATAIRHDAQLLARDRDFAAIARQSPLRLWG